MRDRFLVVCFVAVIMVLALGSIAFAHSAGPCDDSGEPGNSDYARHHIVVVAQSGDLGEADHDDDDFTHNPGTSHHGYSGCNPSGK